MSLESSAVNCYVDQCEGRIDHFRAANLQATTGDVDWLIERPATSAVDPRDSLVSGAEQRDATTICRGVRPMASLD